MAGIVVAEIPLSAQSPQARIADSGSRNAGGQEFVEWRFSEAHVLFGLPMRVNPFRSISKNFSFLERLYAVRPRVVVVHGTLAPAQIERNQ
jgi:hypothetical protein